MIPGVPAHPYVEHDDDHHLKDWLLRLVDGSPDRLALIAVPDPGERDLRLPSPLDVGA